MAPLNVSPAVRPYETLPGLNDISIPAVAPLPSGESPDTQRGRRPVWQGDFGRGSLSGRPDGPCGAGQSAGRGQIPAG